MPDKEPKREYKVGDKLRVNLHHRKIEDAVVRAVFQDADGINCMWMLSAALVDTRQVVE